MRITRRSSSQFCKKEEINNTDQKKNVSFSESEVETTASPSRKRRGRRRNKSSSEFLSATSVTSVTVSSDEGVSGNGIFSPSSIPTIILRPQHKLQQSWTFWFFRNSKTLSWEQNQTKLATVETIEDFWLMINSLQPASQLSSGCDYAVFRSGIFPDWEDFQNMLGGRWIVGEQDKDKLDNNWLELLFLLVGEHAGEQSGLVNGAVANVRSKGNRLAVWLRDSRDMNSVVSIGRLIKSRLLLESCSKIQFSIHMEERERVKKRGEESQPEILL